MTSYWVVGLWMLGSLSVGLISALLAKYYGKEALTSGFLALLLMSNIVAVKIVGFGPWNVPAAILIYSSTFSNRSVDGVLWPERSPKDGHVWIFC